MIFLRRSSAVILLAITLHGPAWAGVKKLTIPTLPVPSLGYFMAPVIKSEGFDKANGLDITFVQKPASTYRTDFAAGTDMIGGSGTILTDVALLNEKGVKTVYLFNVFDFWATVVVPQHSSIRTLADLKGKVLAASLPTASYAMFRYFARLGRLDLSAVEIRGTAVPGLIPTAKSGRADAVELWEPAYSILTYGNDEFRSIDFVSKWKKATGLSSIPYLGVAAHQSWAEQHRPLIEELFKTYQAAVEFVGRRPGDAATIIGKQTRIDPKVLEYLFPSKRLALKLYWAARNREAAKQVFKAAVAIGYLKKMPPDSVLYDPRK